MSGNLFLPSIDSASQKEQMMVNNPFLILTQKKTRCYSDRGSSLPLGPLIVGKDALSEKAGEKSAVQLQGHHALLSILFPYQG